jgi:PAS domain S-box-containing protein
MVDESTKKVMASLAIVPMAYKDLSYGNIVLCFKNSHNFTAEEEALCLALGNTAAQALKIHENEALKGHLAAIVESSEDAIFSKDLSGTILTWNGGAEKLYGYAASEVIGKSVDILIPEKYRNEEQDIMKRIKRGERLETYETWRHHKNGKLIPVSRSVSSIKAGDGKVVGISVIARDITERKKMEWRTKKLLKLRDEFLSIAGHELKTPLTSIKGYAQLLQAELVTDKNLNQKNYSSLALINENTNKMKRMINDLLDISRIQTGRLVIQKSEFWLDELVLRIIAGARLSNPRHDIEFRPESRGKVYADEHRIEQVIQNLLTNAIKYSPNAERIVVTLQESYGFATISVRDFGSGIPKKDHEKLFRRFFQIQNKESFPGLGLGLYISKQIIQLHQGKIWLESELEKGSTFYFTLPAIK